MRASTAKTNQTRKSIPPPASIFTAYPTQQLTLCNAIAMQLRTFLRQKYQACGLSHQNAKRLSQVIVQATYATYISLGKHVDTPPIREYGRGKAISLNSVNSQILKSAVPKLIKLVQQERFKQTHFARSSELHRFVLAHTIVIERVCGETILSDSETPNLNGLLTALSGWALSVEPKTADTIGSELE